MTSHHSPISVAYAQAILELAEQQGGLPQVQQLADDLSGVLQVVKENRSFGLYLSDPGIAQNERDDLIQRVFGNTGNPLLLNSLRLINSRGRLKELPQIVSAYLSLLDQKLGRVDAEITLAQPMSEHDLTEVGHRVSAALGKTATLTQKVDDSIIGGLVLRVGDKIIDASVKQQLKEMKQSLLASAPA